MTEYPTLDIRLVRKIVSGAVVTEKTVLHRDGLGSVRNRSKPVIICLQKSRS